MALELATVRRPTNTGSELRETCEKTHRNGPEGSVSV
jgi:hypothetical protein